MKLSAEQKKVIRWEIEEALLWWEDFRLRQKASPGQAKVIPKVPEKLGAYLEILDEVDAVGGYMAGKTAWRDRHEKKALEMFLGGARIAEIGREMRKDEIRFDELHAWLYGSETRDGIVSAMFARFMELNRYCPFCSVDGARGPKGSPYPLTGKSCPHREIEEVEE